MTGEAFVRLIGRNGNTFVSYHADTELGGALSGVGIRMVKGIARMLLGQFFKKLAKRLVFLS